MALAVLITYHNEGPLLTECLQSLARQSKAVDSILVHDDASRIPAQEFIPSAMNVTVLRSEKNVGPSAGRNRLLRATDCEWVHFHDSDDLFDDNWCAEVSKVCAPDLDMVLNYVEFMYEHDPARAHWEWRFGIASNKEEFVASTIRSCVLAVAGTYRRSAVLGVGGYREDLWWSEDWDFHIRLAASDIRCALIPQALILCRSRLESRSKRLGETYLSALQAIPRLAEEIDKKYHRDLADAAVRFGSQLFRLGDHASARRAFALAQKIGPPKLEFYGATYRILSRMLGLETTEQIGAMYRTLVPEALRRTFAAYKTSGATS